MQWIECATERPPIVDMGQTDHVLVAYFPAPDTNLKVGIAFYDQDGPGSGWLESGTFRALPAPRYWMPIPDPPTMRSSRSHAVSITP
jgi:hypothetical protein